MASELAVGLTIGAALGGSFKSAFASAESTTKRLGKTAEDLRARQARLGEVMAKAFAHPTRNVGEMRREYERLGSTVDKLTKKQAALAASMAKQKGLSDGRKELRGQAMETLGTAAALGAPVIKSVMVAANFQESLRDLRISANLDASQEASLGKAVREGAKAGGQSWSAVAGGVGALMKGGMGAEQAGSYAGLMASTMTALKQSESVVAGAMEAFSDMGVGDKDGQQRTLDKLVAIGEKGNFKPDMLVQAFADLGDTLKKSGMAGEKAIGQLAAGLQVAEGAMGAEDAKAGQKSWLESMTNPARIKASYESAGIDYAASMAKLQKQGLSQYDASLELANAFIRDRLTEKDQKALLAGDKDGNVAAMLQQMGLGEVFRDANAARYALEIGRNKGRTNDLAGAGTDQAGGIDKLAALRKETTSAQFTTFKDSISDLGITIGSTLLPALNGALNAIKPVISTFADLAAAHPGLVSGLVGVVGGLVGMKLGMIGIKYAINLFVLSPLNAAKATFALVSGKSLLFVGGLSRLASSAGRFASAAGSLGRVLGGHLLSGLRLAGQAVLFIGRALMANPIGLAIAAIGIAAFVIYKYWEPIKGFFGGLWGEVKAAFDGGIGSVCALIINWSPLGLFYKAFAGVMAYFGVELPSSFSTFGGHLIDGLVGGISAKIGAAKESIVGFGQNIKGWFTETLGIKSPSTVFAGFGDNIAEGAAMGIGRSAGLAEKAAMGLAADVLKASGAPDVAVAAGDAAPSFPFKGKAGMGMGSEGEAGRVSSAQASININFSPTITVQGNAADGVKGQVQQAMQLSLRELETLIERIVGQQARASY